MVTSVSTPDNDHDHDQIVNSEVEDSQAAIDSSDASLGGATSLETPTTTEPATQEPVTPDIPAPEPRPIRLFGRGTSGVTLPTDTDLLKGFNINDYKAGVGGDQRFIVLDLFLGLLVGQRGSLEAMKVYGICQTLREWDKRNNPGLDSHSMVVFIKAHRDKWMHYHYRRKTPGYVAKPSPKP